jgi:hypothetical protein
MSTGQVYMLGLFGIPVEEGRERAGERIADKQEGCPCEPRAQRQKLCDEQEARTGEIGWGCV